MSDQHEELLKRYEKLPPAVREVMFAEASADKIEELGKKYGFLIDKIGKLADEVGYFMLGMTHPRDFPRQLMRELDISESKANEIVNELNDSIFKPIRKQLADLHGADESELEPQKSQSFAPPSFASKPAVPLSRPLPPITPRQVSIPQTPQKPPVIPAPPPVAAPPPVVAPMIFPQKISPPMAPKKEIPKAPAYVPSTPPPVTPILTPPTVPVPPPLPATPTIAPPQAPKPAAPLNPSDPYHEPVEP